MIDVYTYIQTHNNWFRSGRIGGTHYPKVDWDVFNFSRGKREFSESAERTFEDSLRRKLEANT